MALFSSWGAFLIHLGPQFRFDHVENKVKIPLIEAISSVHKFDIIALSETYLNDTIPNNEIETEGYSSDIFRSDHPTNTKRGGVCLYYKNTLPIKLRSDLHILDESIVVELTLSRKKLFFVVIYRSPSQSSDEFDLFLSRLELVIEHMRHEKPDCIILTGDFNSKTILRVVVTILECCVTFSGVKLSTRSFVLFL